MSKKKKKIIIFSVIIAILIISIVVFFLVNKNTTETEETNVEVSSLKELPKPEITGGSRGELGIDKNINEATIDEYLNREDSVYRDMRMLEDPGNYEAIGGDRYLSGYVEGFEVIPLPFIIPVTDLPSEVGDTYTGTTLFYNNNGTYIANYKESIEIIEEIFPKDKVIFLMCGGGGYSGMTKNFLVSMGWDENKIYNTGGYWYYKGDHNITVKKEVNGVVSYDFDNVPYHKIDFDELTKSKNYKEPTIKVTDLKLNIYDLEIEEGTSFQLNVIVLPNNATNKKVKWSSDNEMVATVTDDGLVNAMGAGNTTISVQSADGNRIISCEVIVNKKVVSTRIKLDDVSKEAKEFASYDVDEIRRNFYSLVDNPDGTPNEKYYDIYEDGGYRVNDLWREEYEKYQEREKEAENQRIRILDTLTDKQKSFIMLIYSKDCEERDYSVIEGAEKLLKEKNFSYFYVGTQPTNGEATLEKIKLDTSKLLGGSVAIIKNGEIYASIDPDKDALKNDEETKNWLSKYIEIE